MKENVLDVLMFLFDNYLTVDQGMPEDEATLACELEEAGFQATNIHKAFDWLGELAEINQGSEMIREASLSSFRVFDEQELFKLDVSCRGFLLQLEEMGLIDPPIRELILERAMAIEAVQLSLQQFKRIIGLVMINSPHHDEALLWLDELIYDEKTLTSLH